MARARTARRRSDAGLATVWAAWWMVGLLTVGAVGLLVGIVASGQHHVDGSADLVAVSAAARRQGGGDACASAVAIAAANRVRLESCEVDGADVEVQVSATLRLPLGLDGRVVAQARAGPQGLAATSDAGR